MSRPKSVTLLTFALAVSASAMSVSVIAAESSPQCDAACRQARRDLQFMQQLAATDGNTNPYLNGPTLQECTDTGRTKEVAIKKPHNVENAFAGISGVSSPAAVPRYN